MYWGGEIYTSMAELYNIWLSWLCSFVNL